MDDFPQSSLTLAQRGNLEREFSAPAHTAVVEAHAEALRLYEAALALLETLGAPAVRRSPGQPPPVGLQLVCEGDVWALSCTGASTVRLRHSMGLGYLNHLVSHPGRHIHVAELCGVRHRTGDGGALLDARAKADYARRVDDLRELIAEAESFGDSTRARRLHEELEVLSEQLAAAVGLGGRDRRASSEVQRLRVNVQRRLKDVVVRSSAANRDLGRHLALTLRTGTYCVYEPR